MEEIRAIEIALLILGERFVSEDKVYEYQVERVEDAPIVKHVAFFRVLPRNNIELLLKSVGNSYCLFGSVGYAYDRLGYGWEQLMFYSRQDKAAAYARKEFTKYGTN